MILYEWIDPRGRGAISEWAGRLEKVQQAQLDAKMRRLARTDDWNVAYSILEGPIPSFSRLRKLKVGASIRLRPIGFREGDEVTFLIGATERGDRWDPRNAPEKAEERRLELLEDNTRRQLYEV